MRIVLLFLALGVAIVALRIVSALKTAHSTRKELDDTKAAAANALQDQKASREEKTVPANAGSPVSGAGAPGGTSIQIAAPPAVSSDADRRKSERKEMWVDSYYCWVVLCKNHWFHLRQNLFFRHRIPLAETDPVATRPSLEGRFRVRCDNCRKEYFYKPSDVLKSEIELPDSFAPHPLFRDY